jgi:uncharacterized protein DUF4365
MIHNKQIPHRSVVGQQGINLVEKIVLEMGFAWHPSNQSLEAGLDGFIEIRNPETGEAFNSVIFVQSKSTEGEFVAETPSSFEFVCDERDLNYWLKGNAPIVLVRSRPKTNEAYWVSIKEYFHDLSMHATKKIHFDKAANRFDRIAASIRTRHATSYSTIPTKRTRRAQAIFVTWRSAFSWPSSTVSGIWS